MGPYSNVLRRPYIAQVVPLSRLMSYVSVTHTVALTFPLTPVSPGGGCRSRRCSGSFP